MRPPEFTGGNVSTDDLHSVDYWTASMRPPEFTGGNVGMAAADRAGDASMRPPEFTGGNSEHCLLSPAAMPASMRPPEFTGGNCPLLADNAPGQDMLQ